MLPPGSTSFPLCSLMSAVTSLAFPILTAPRAGRSLGDATGPGCVRCGAVVPSWLTQGTVWLGDTAGGSVLPRPSRTAGSRSPLPSCSWGAGGGLPGERGLPSARDCRLRGLSRLCRVWRQPSDSQGHRPASGSCRSALGPGFHPPWHQFSARAMQGELPVSWHGDLVAAGMGKGSGVPQRPRCLSLVPHDVVRTGGQGAKRGLVAAAWGRAQLGARGGDLSRRNRAAPSLIQGMGWVTGGPGVSGFCKHQLQALAEPRHRVPWVSSSLPCDTGVTGGGPGTRRCGSTHAPTRCTTTTRQPRAPKVKANLLYKVRT